MLEWRRFDLSEVSVRRISYAGPPASAAHPAARRPARTTGRRPTATHAGATKRCRGRTSLKVVVVTFIRQGKKIRNFCDRFGAGHKPKRNVFLFEMSFFQTPEPYASLPLHGEKDFVASAKRFVIIASANQNCCGDNFNCNNNMNSYHKNYSFRRNKENCHPNNSGLLWLY